jgi:hypothetical protein
MLVESESTGESFMGEFLDTLHRVKERVDRYGSKGINEQDTKATLIQPVLRSLGWDVEDLEDVQREYKIRKQDKPVDFALFLLRTPCLFVEAKGLSQNLDDRKWANQIMGYAGVAGVGWVVLSDGNEYRLYNSHAKVPIDEKLFRSVKIADDPAVACETLALLSKERMNESEIDVLWNAHFVDRQLKSAISELFSPAPDPAVIRLLAKKVPNLSPKEVRASLQRASLIFDFPIKTGIDRLSSTSRKTRPTSKPATGPIKKGRVTRKFFDLGVKSSEVVPRLLRDGILRAGLEISADYRGETLVATITSDGQVKFRGAKYKSPSAAGAAAKAFVSGKFMATDGWSFWSYMDGNGANVPLSVAREHYLAKHKQSR